MKALTAVVSLVTVTLACIVGLLVSQGPASADGGCPPGQAPQVISGGQTICVVITDPGHGGGGTDGGHTTTTSTGTATCLYNGQQIPCVTDHGVWYSTHQCYAQLADPQPAATDPVWGGNSPTDGDMWVCTNANGVTDWGWFFVRHGETPTLVNPGELAQTAEGQMDLATPAIHLAPSPPLLTYVGLPTWLWMDSANFNTLQITVTAGGTTVTVTAVPTQALWNLTDGTTTCTSEGRAWVTGMSSSQQTDCSYTFQHTSDFQPGKKFAVSSALTYQVDWTCSGACSIAGGTLGQVPGPAGTAAIQVGERQSVVTESRREAAAR